MDIKFEYLPDKNVEGAFIDGVPLADVTQELWDSLPKHVQGSVERCPFYRAVKQPKRPTGKDGE